MMKAIREFSMREFLEKRKGACEFFLASSGVGMWNLYGGADYWVQLPGMPKRRLQKSSIALFHFN